MSRKAGWRTAAAAAPRRARTGPGRLLVLVLALLLGVSGWLLWRHRQLAAQEARLLRLQQELSSLQQQLRQLRQEDRAQQQELQRQGLDLPGLRQQVQALRELRRQQQQAPDLAAAQRQPGSQPLGAPPPESQPVGAPPPESQPLGTPGGAPAAGLERLSRRAEAALARGQWYSARELSATLLTLRPGDRRAAQILGQAACRLRDRKRALRALALLTGGERERLRRRCQAQGLDLGAQPSP